MEFSSQAIREWAEAVTYKRDLTEDQKDISVAMDEWAKEIGNTGKDTEHEIAAYIQKTLDGVIDEKLDEIMEMIFEIGQIGEFDKTTYYKDKGNTLIAYDSAIGGNVPKSYIDIDAIQPKMGHAQVETSISYVDLRKNGFRSIAKLTTYAEEALLAKVYSDVFNVLVQSISGGANAITESSNAPTMTNMDKLVLHLEDKKENGDQPVIFTLNKYAQAIARMNTLTPYLSDAQKAEYAKFGFGGEYAGIPVKRFSGTGKLKDGKPILPDKTILGIGGKIGELNMRGSIRVLETMDNQKEKVDLKIAGMSYEFAITNIDKAAKVTMQA